MLLLLTWCGCVTVTVVALWNTWRRFEPGRSVAGVIVFWTGIAFWVWGRVALGEHFAQVARAPELLVTRGPFRFVRHPLYSATTIACLGQAVAAGSVLGFALWLGTLSILAVRARREERLLGSAFGPLWDEYARRTPRILP